MFRKHRIAIVVAAAYNFVLFFPTLFLGRVVSPNDVFFNYDPWSMVREVTAQNSVLNDPPTSLLTLISLLRKGVALHWNPFVASGIPGTLSASLISPFIVIPTFAVPLPWVYTAILFLKLNVAFLFAYAWLREERLGKRGAAIGAMIFAGSGVYGVRWLWQATNATALYPALLWLVHRTFRGKRTPVAWIAILALAYALAGFPSTMAYGAYLAAAYALFLAIRSRRIPLKRVGEVVAGVVLALFIASPFLAPFIQLVRRTGYLGMRHELSLTIFYPLAHAASFVRPDRLGNPAYKDWRGDPALGMLNNYYECTIYLGLAALPLAAIALFNRRARTRWFWAAAAVVILSAMFGLAFVPAILGRLPGFRYSPLARTVMLLPVAAGYLSGAGASMLSRRRRLGQGVALLLAVAIAGDLGLFAGRFYPYLHPEETVVPTTPVITFLGERPKPFRVGAFFDYLWPNSAELFQIEDVRSHFGSEALYRRMLQRIDPTAWSGRSTVLAFDGRTFRYDDPFLALLGVRYLLEKPAIDIAKWSTFRQTVPGVHQTSAVVLPPGRRAERTIRVDAEPFWAAELPVSMEEQLGKSPRLVVQLFKFGTVVWERTFTPVDLAAIGKIYVPIRPYARLGDELRVRMTPLDMRARILTGDPVPGETPLFYGRVKTPVVFDRLLPDGRVFLNLAELSRFRATAKAETLDDEQILARRDLDFEAVSAVAPGQPPFQNDGGSAATVSLIDYSPEQQRLSTDAPAPFLLISSEKLTPELAISVDGVPARPFRVNVMFAGVQVPAGAHHVVFSRRIGRGWWWPCFLAVAALVVVALWEAFVRAKEPRLSTPAPPQRRE